jgi:DNA-binding Lrp family transcriptional regulator
MVDRAIHQPNSGVVELDDLDRRILEILQANGRTTNAALAEAVGLTATPMLQRIKKLEQRGVIRGYTARLDRAALGLGILAYVHVQMAEHRLEAHRAFVEAIGGFDEVLECHHISGEEDFLLQVAVKDIAAYEAFLLHGLSKIAGIGRVKTTFVLSSPKVETPLPVRGGTP